MLMLHFLYLGYCIIATYSGSAGASVREVDPSKLSARILERN